MQISIISPQLLSQNLEKQKNNQVSKSISCQSVNFGSKPSSKIFSPLNRFTKPISDCYDHTTDEMAKGFVKFLHLKPVEKIVKNAAESKHMNKYLFAHLTAVTSMILSGFYIEKTLENKNLDEKKKKTLAINQAVVTVLSTIAAYFVDVKLGDRYGRFMDVFAERNKGNKNIAKHISGLKMLKTTVIFGTIYRFIAPVIATPIANAIGNRVNNKESLIAQSKNLKVV